MEAQLDELDFYPKTKQKTALRIEPPRARTPATASGGFFYHSDRPSLPLSHRFHPIDALPWGPDTE